jgi:hypothetical protein
MRANDQQTEHTGTGAGRAISGACRTGASKAAGENGGIRPPEPWRQKYRKWR